MTVSRIVYILIVVINIKSSVCTLQVTAFRTTYHWPKLP